MRNARACKSSALYNPAAGYRTETFSRLNSGITQLGHVCYETGGEAYFKDNDPLTSIKPYLADITEHLAHQYLLKFRFEQTPKPGYQALYIHPTSFKTEVMVPDSVFVPVSK